ncbi:MAG TPA: outer membrane beta-barrel protein [Verrucomicrobiae bacterium]|jgi:hypothetical protein|nr:outer membrane beta-barrel protein [Verrucomicrobiae bacterium]
MMNKWTIGLAAVGAVSLASVAQAEEQPSPLTTLSSTILSGYVDTSAQWNLGDGTSHAPAYKYGGASKADGFNLDVVKLTIERPLDENEWAAGYKVDMLFGPDANTLATQSSTSTGADDFAIKQAYVVLRAPVGNGLDIKMGVFDSVIGYESTEAINNPNFSRSWGHTFEPSEHTGVLASYRLNEIIAFSGGITDTLSPSINGRSGSGPLVGGPNESYKTYLGSTSLTAPDSWGFLNGSTFYAGIVEGWNGGIGPGASQQNYYLGATFNTPVSGLRLGASFDYARTDKTLTPVGIAGTPFPSFQAHSFAGYASYQVLEKLSVHGRVEYADITPLAASLAQGVAGIGLPSSVLSATATVQYDLWKNVLSRIEIRWDHALDGTDAFGGTTAAHIQSGHTVTGSQQDSFIIAANLIYKF